MATKGTLYDFEVGTSHSVNVTHINDPHSFYVRSANEDDILALLETPGVPLTEKEIILGKTVVYRSKTLDKYVRGEIRLISTQNNQVVYDIFAIDYGCFDQSVPLKYVRNIGSLTEQESLTPPLAVHCQLDMCEAIGGTFTADAVDSMKFYVGKHAAEIIIRGKTKDKLKVFLKTPDCPGDVSTMMALLHITAMTKSTNAVNRFAPSAPVAASPSLKFKMKIPKVGATLHVRVLTGQSLSEFYVAEVADHKTYVKDHESFNYHCKNQPALKNLNVGTCCGVNVSNFISYERAIVLQETVPNEKAMVRLIDLGKDTEVHFLNMKSVSSEQFYDKPAIAMLCSTESEQTWKTGLPMFLYPGYEFMIIIKEVGNGIDVPHKVNLSKIKN